MGTGDRVNGVYSIKYDSSNHVGVIFRWKGSVWKRTLPYCILNFLLSLLINYLKDEQELDLGFTDKGHTMMTLFVSFLIVSRVGISIGRFNDCRGYLATMIKEAQDVVQNLALFTKRDQSDEAKQFRLDVAYDMCILLRMAMAVIDYPSERIPCWTLPELRGKTKEYIMKSIEISQSTSAHGEAEMNMRVPVQMAYSIRDQIVSIKHFVNPTTSKVEFWQDGKLYGSLDSFMNAYHGMHKFLTTPFPFPLVQMARTLMFIYLYTLPFALLNVADNRWVGSTIVFLVTYGFVGLESVSIELDDPFGNDDNDFDNLGMMYTAWEANYVTVCIADGEAWMNKLIAKLSIDGNGDGHVASQNAALAHGNVPLPMGSPLADDDTEDA